MEDLLKQQTGYTYFLLIDNIFSAWKIAFMVNNIQEDTTILASAFAPYAFATQHKNIEYVDITLEGNIDPRMLKKAQSSDALVIHHFLTTPYKQQHQDLCVIEDLTNMLGRRIERDYRYDTALVDFQQLLDIKAAALLFDDEKKYFLAKQLASTGIEPKKLWNFDVKGPAYNVWLEPKLLPCLQTEFKEFLSQYPIRREKANFLNASLSVQRLLQPTSINDSSSFLYYPLFLLPPLYCPKEEIYSSLCIKNLEIHVDYKPIYKLKQFEKHLSLFVTEDLYKSELSIKLTTLHSKQEIIEGVNEVLQEYSHRGFSF